MASKPMPKHEMMEYAPEPRVSFMLPKAMYVQFIKALGPIALKDTLEIEVKGTLTDLHLDGDSCCSLGLKITDIKAEAPEAEPSLDNALRKTELHT